MTEKFESILSDHKSEVEQVDFIDTKDVINMINHWINEHTYGTIQKAVDESFVKAESELLAINSLHLRAYWADPFDKNSIANHDFLTANKTTNSIPFMIRYGGYRQGHIDELNLFTIELPFESDSNIVFWILIPHESSSIDEIKNVFNSDVITSINNKLKARRVILKLPLFEIETQINVKEILKSLGIETLFNVNIFNVLDNGHLLKMDDVRNKNRIKIDTDGTQAASVDCMMNFTF